MPRRPLGFELLFASSCLRGKKNVKFVTRKYPMNIGEMITRPSQKMVSMLQLFESLPDNERIIVDVLRQIVKENLPSSCKEKLSFNVPYFYGKRGICIIWPSSIPRGGIHQGVLLGFWQGHKLKDEDAYLTHGTNKKVFYKIFNEVNEIDEAAIVKLVKEAVRVDSLSR